MNEKPFLCKIGIHRKRELGMTLFFHWAHECERCHRRWLHMLYAVLYEDMPPGGWADNLFEKAAQ